MYVCMYVYTYIYIYIYMFKPSGGLGRTGPAAPCGAPPGAVNMNEYLYVIDINGTYDSCNYFNSTNNNYYDTIMINYKY